MAIYTTGTVSVYFVADNPAKKVTNLSNSTSPIYKYANLQWTEPSSPGMYHLYWLVGGNWQSANTSTSSNSLKVIPPANATKAQLRTDNLYPSNTINIIFHVKPETRVLTATSRYDGVLLDWTPNTDIGERVEVVRNGTTVFTGTGSSYIHETGGSFKVRMVKGTGSDVVYGPFSNTVSASLLSPPPPRPEPEAPCDFFLGVNRAGDEILHICNPNVVPAAPPAVESGKTATDWFQDWVGINVDYGDDTYMHSMFDYVKCLTYIRITEYTDDVFRKFYFSDALNPVTGSSVSYTPSNNRFTLVVTVDKLGNRRGAAPVIRRSIDFDNNSLAQAEYSIGGFGYGNSGAFYENGDAYIRTGQSIESIEIYEFNIRASGRDLVYETAKTGASGIKLDPDDFIVDGADFSGMFLAYTGKGYEGDYINSMNLNDPIIPVQGLVDPLGVYSGPDGSDTVQVLGGSGGSGWDIEMTKGLIKRGGNTWFNAGRGRTRLRYVGSSTDHTTPVYSFNIPPHETNSSGEGVITGSGILTDLTIILDDPAVRNAACLGYSITPVAWDYSSEQQAWDDTFSSDKGIIGFSSFNNRVPFYTMRESYRYDYEQLPSGDPYWNTWYTIQCSFYFKRINESLISIEYDFWYYSFNGSAGLENTITIPGFSYSFIGLN